MPIILVFWRCIFSIALYNLVVYVWVAVTCQKSCRVQKLLKFADKRKYLFYLGFNEVRNLKNGNDDLANYPHLCRILLGVNSEIVPMIVF